MHMMRCDQSSITIRTASDLDFLLAAHWHGWSRRRVRIELALPVLMPRDRARYERSLSRAASACGCAEAAAWWTAAIGIGCVAVTFVAGVVIGKLFGLVLARRRFSRLISELRDVPGVIP
jgi:ABC-type sulfate transport system permease component